MQKSELELIIETIPDAVTIFDRNGNITYANSAAETILGLSRSEIKMRTYNAPGWKITTPDGKPYPEEELPFVQVMKLKKPVYGIEHAIEHPNGKRVILSINAAPLLDEKGNITSIVVSLTDITGQKIVEFALRESEKRFRELLKEIDFAAVVLDTSGRIEFANDYILDVVELTWDSVKLKDFFNVFVAADQKENAKNEFLNSLSKGTMLKRYELDIETFKDGRRTISFSNVIIRNTNGNITGVASVGEDVTKQRRAAEEIRESRRQVLDILESITDGFYALDNDWRFTYVNRRAEELFGIKREQLLFRNIWQVMRKEQVPEMFEKYHQAKKEMSPGAFEEFAPRLSKWLEMHVYPYQNGLSVYIRDITDRKQAEKALKESERHLEEAQRMAHVGSWDRDLDVGIIYLSDEAYRIFGLTLEKRFLDLAEWHKQWLKLLHPEDRERLSRAYEDALSDRRPYDEEYRIIRPNGEVRFIHSRARIERDVSGKPRHVFGVMQDITERKRVEERVMLLNFALDHIREAAYLTDRNARFVYVNEEVLRVLGYSRDELLGGMTVLDVDVEMTKEAWEQHWQELKKSGSIIFARLHKAKDGRMFPVEVNANLFYYQGVSYNLALARYRRA